MSLDALPLGVARPTTYRMQGERVTPMGTGFNKMAQYRRGGMVFLGGEPGRQIIGGPNDMDLGVRGATTLRNVTDPDQTLSDVSMRDWRTYQDMYQPLIDDMIESANSRDIVEGAQDRIEGMGERTSEIRGRQASRSLASLTPAQRKALERRGSFTTAQESDAAINNARIQQRDTNQNRRAELISTALGAAQQGSQGLSQAAGMQASREMANANASASARNQNLGLATAALMAFLI